MELLDIANYLEEKNERDAAHLAFELGYAEFWRQGQDPRLTSFLLIPGSNIRPDTPPSIQRELADRAYATGPWVDGAAKAWDLYAKSLAASGDDAGAALWQERAKDARANGLLVSGDQFYYEALAASLVTTTSLAAAVLYVVVLYSRYRPQRQARRAAERAAGVSRPGFCNIEYWRRNERLAFLSIVAVAWIAEGVAGTSLRASSNRSFGYFFDLRSGTLFGSSTTETLESRGVKGPERDLLMAIAYQRDGQPDEAIKLYKGLPQFAEGWNNLGVLLKNSGDDEGSRRAFEHAVQLRPDFPEAEWNLGKPARGDWVKLHERFAVDKPMMTVPRRAQVLKAFGIRESSVDWARVLAGPLENDGAVNNFFRPSGRLRAGVLIFFAAGALVLLFLRPRELTLAPPRYQVIPELLFPGTARLWGLAGGILLGAACYFSSALWPAVWSRFYSYMNYSSSFRRFPLPFSVTRGGAPELFSPIPSFRWFLALMALNAAVVLFWKWRRK
jgi:tetratricopeptide (TPR) repeat protein